MFLGFHTDYFDFLSHEIKALGKTISENLDKYIQKCHFVFGVVNQILKDVVFQLLPFKIYNHLFFCLKGNRMVGKCKFCSRILIRDIDHARKIENYFKVTNKGIEGTSISVSMNETNAKSIVLNLYYLVDDFSLAENFHELFVEIVNNLFGLYILFLQIYFRVFWNALSDVKSLVIRNYLLEHEIKTDIGKVKRYVNI